MKRPIKTLSNRLRHRAKGVTLAGVAAVLLTAAGASSGQQQQQQAPGEMPELITAPIQEKAVVLQAPAPDERRVYVVDAAAFNVYTRVMPIDGNNAAYLGTLDTGLLPLPVVSPKDGTVYIADTRYELFSHRKRDDFVAVIDPRNLLERRLIDIPEGRFLMMVLHSMTTITPDGNYLLFYQFAPKNAVGIVDLQQNKFLNMIATPQCYYAFPASNRRVVLHCRDASLLQIQFDAQGQQTGKSQTKPFHDPEKEPTFDNPAFDSQSGRIYFVSYWGRVFPVDISGKQIQTGKPFELVTKEERDQKWAPGGWQPAAYHRGSGRLFVLMDQRARWAHTSESRHVWVYDTKTGKRVQTIALAHEACCIGVDQNAKDPYLYALSSHDKALSIYQVSNGLLRGTVDELGHEPRLVVVPESAPGRGG